MVAGKSRTGKGFLRVIISSNPYSTYGVLIKLNSNSSPPSASRHAEAQARAKAPGLICLCFQHSCAYFRAITVLSKSFLSISQL